MCSRMLSNTGINKKGKYNLEKVTNFVSWYSYSYTHTQPHTKKMMNIFSIQRRSLFICFFFWSIPSYIPYIVSSNKTFYIYSSTNKSSKSWIADPTWHIDTTLDFWFTILWWCFLCLQGANVCICRYMYIYLCRNWFEMHTKWGMNINFVRKEDDVGIEVSVVLFLRLNLCIGAIGMILFYQDRYLGLIRKMSCKYLLSKTYLDPSGNLEALANTF